MKKLSGFPARLAALLLCLALLLAAFPAFAENEKGDAFVFEDAVPQEYMNKRVPEKAGRVERIRYMSKDYHGDGADVEKRALVYLPWNYDDGEPCDVLILCHGVGGTESEWQFNELDTFSLTKNLTDHVFADGSVKNLIIVMPNGRSTANFSDTSFGNWESFKEFGQELRNDLLPYLDAHYHTWGSLTPDDLSASRDHRAMAGLSMGGMQTINIGLCECLDLISAFGAFSAAPTSNTAAQIASNLKAFPEDLEIRYFYSVCGLQDGTAYAAASAAAKTKPADSRLTEDNWHWQEVPGGHDMNIWRLGLYNFLRLLGSMQE